MISNVQSKFIIEMVMGHIIQLQPPFKDLSFEKHQKVKLIIWLFLDLEQGSVPFIYNKES